MNVPGPQAHLLSTNRRGFDRLRSKHGHWCSQVRPVGVKRPANCQYQPDRRMCERYAATAFYQANLSCHVHIFLTWCAECPRFGTTICKDSYIEKHGGKPKVSDITSCYGLCQPVCTVRVTIFLKCQVMSRVMARRAFACVFLDGPYVICGNWMCWASFRSESVFSPLLIFLSFFLQVESYSSVWSGICTIILIWSCVQTVGRRRWTLQRFYTDAWI